MNENIQITDAQMVEAAAVLADPETDTTQACIFVQTAEETGENDTPVTVH